MSSTSPRWVDAHCHFYEEEPDDLLERAKAAGVDACVVIGTDEESSLRAVRIASGVDHAGSWPKRFAAVGLHPHDAIDGVGPIGALLDRAVVPRGDGRSPGSVVAVGECGLDYHYDHSPRETQRAAFAEQIELAHHHDLTLVIHTREAWDDTFAVLGDAGIPERTIIHCFTGGPLEARRCLDAGAFLSFSGIVTFKNAGEVREAAAICPLDRMLVETDAPYLAPVPHRGRPNEPGFVPLVGEFLAELLDLDVAELAGRTEENTRRAFAARW